jgi:hypothetical protein
MLAPLSASSHRALQQGSTETGISITRRRIVRCPDQRTSFLHAISRLLDRPCFKIFNRNFIPSLSKSRCLLPCSSVYLVTFFRSIRNRATDLHLFARKVSTQNIHNWSNLVKLGQTWATNRSYSWNAQDQVHWKQVFESPVHFTGYILRNLFKPLKHPRKHRHVMIWKQSSKNQD